MKILSQLFLVSLLSLPAAFAQGPETTDVMGGGTPGRADENRMSKQQYDYEEEEGYLDELKEEEEFRNSEPGADEHEEYFEEQGPKGNSAQREAEQGELQELNKKEFNRKQHGE